METLLIDPSRVINAIGDTGIYVRAQNSDGGFESVDIAVLTKESLLTWLHGRGGKNKWAEDVVGILLGHGHLHKLEE